MIFTVSEEDVANLNDGDLRTLTAFLAQQELLKQGFSTSHVTHGGDQRAADGGIDVRVALDSSATTTGYVPRAQTGFQVKADDMPAGNIAAEMTTKTGELKPVISELAAQGGSYVIVSSKGTVSDIYLTKRKKAMHDTVTFSFIFDACITGIYALLAVLIVTGAGYVMWRVASVCLNILQHAKEYPLEVVLGALAAVTVDLLGFCGSIVGAAALSGIRGRIASNFVHRVRHVGVELAPQPAAETTEIPSDGASTPATPGLATRQSPGRKPGSGREQGATTPMAPIVPPRHRPT